MIKKMAYYNYFARNQNGEAVLGTMQSESEGHIANYLLQQGLFPIKIVEEKKINFYLKSFKNEKIWARISSDEISAFSNQLSILLKGGTPLNKALLGISSGISNLYFRKIIQSIMRHVETGLSFYHSVCHYPDHFPEMMRNLILIGEQTGKLDLVLKSVAELMDMQKNVKQKMIEAFRYPFILFFTMMIASIILGYWILPQFAEIFSRFHVELPFVTQCIFKFSHFFKHYFLIIAGSFAILFLYLLKLSFTEKGKIILGEAVYRIPILGGILKKMMWARFSGAFSFLLSSKVPALQAMTLVGKGMDNIFVKNKIMDVRSKVEEGLDLVRALTEAQLFPPLMLQMISSGEESGTMDEMLRQVALFYEQQVTYELSRLSELLSPLLLMIMAGFVLVFSLGVFLPMWDLGTIAFKH